MEQLLDRFILSSVSSAEVVKSIHDQHLDSWKQFLETLPHLKKSGDLLIKTLKVIGLKLTEFSSDEGDLLSKSLMEKQIRILSVTCSNGKFIQAVKLTIKEWSLREDKKEELGMVLLLMYSFCTEILSKIPEFGKDFLYNLVCTVAGVVWSSQHLSGVDESILRGFRKLETKIQRICEEWKVEEEKRRYLAEIKEYEKILHEGEAPEDFRGIGVVPSLGEILREGIPFLRPNKVFGGYDSSDDYLGTQFRLLREDFVRPLRECVREFIRNRCQSGIGRPATTSIPKDNSVRIYNDVMFSKIEMSPVNGRDYLFSLPPELTRSVNWDKSKRLLSGCLVMLTSDNFKTAHFGITLVPPNDPKGKVGGDWRRRELADGIIRLHIEVGGDGVKRGERYVLFESEAYFEAYKHNLKILQQIRFLDPGNSPMAKYIVSASSLVGAPSYLIRRGGGSSPGSDEDFDAVGVMKLKLPLSDDEIMTVGVLEPEKWDSGVIRTKMGLNVDQFDALRMALTSEIAVIQGPPGTGKTFVGLQIVKTLLMNRKRRGGGGEEEMVFGLGPAEKKMSGFCGGVVPDLPILVLCYTNHALDQFLELLLDKIPGLGVVRVGGMCKSEKLEQFTLSKIRKEIIDKIGGQPTNFRRYKYEEGQALRWLGRVEQKISHVKVEIEELRKPNGVFCFSKMEVYRKLTEKSYVPKKVLDDLRAVKWLGIEWELFNGERFVVEELITGGFKLNFAWLKNQLGRIVEMWEGVGSAGGGVEVGPQDEEDYDMDELMEKRIFDDDGNAGEVEEQVNGTDTEEYRDSIYFNSCSVRGCRKMAEQCGERVGRSSDRAQYENKREFISAVLGLYKGGFLKLPPLDDKYQAQNVGDDDARYRWAVYFRVVKVAHDFAVELERELREDLEAAKRKLEKARERLFSAREEFLKAQEVLNATILKKRDVIGMTTTGAAKNHSLLEKAGAKIVIVEEAAEILEAHIVTALTKHCEHLILIGDHLQLRPSTTVYELGKDYRMNVSLFERLILNNVPYCTLKTQHRMRPEISNLIIGPIYKELLNHDSVNIYPMIRGVFRSMFFVDHKQFEDNDTDLASKSNMHEVLFITGLCNYLVKQGYAKDKITILTMYTGQMFQIKKMISRELELDCRGVRVTCVDSYQGEENDIILLSLVRSNEQSSVGFVGIDNRVCVALSRARHGMYVIGNMECLSKKSRTWKAVNRKLKHTFCIGDGLELICEKHMKRNVVKSGQDFLKFKSGGCDVVCEEELPCGHKCPLLCHMDKTEHERVKCKGACTRKLEGCGHVCGGICGEKCGECLVEVAKELPCGHKGLVACSKDPSTTKCGGFSEKTLGCGHQMKMHCNESTDTAICNEQVEFVFGTCGHKRKIVCRESKTVNCTHHCNLNLSCGHTCLRTCHWNDDPAHLSYECPRFCERFCKNDHPCIEKHKCHENCPPCSVLGRKELPCGHSQMVLCGVGVKDHKCTVKVRGCGNKCRGGHLCEVEHACGDHCPPCQVEVATELPCQHKAMIPCHVDQPGVYQCVEKVRKRLSCGHYSLVECHQFVDLVRCSEMVDGICGYCDFKGPVKCGNKLQLQICKACEDKGVGNAPRDPRSGAKRRKRQEEVEMEVEDAGSRRAVVDIIILD